MGKTVYIGNSSFETTGDRLTVLFAGHGKVTDVRVISDQYTGRPKGFAFVNMATEAAAEAAISELNGLTVSF
jgi:RNA recognition motif-containing protein